MGSPMRPAEFSLGTIWKEIASVSKASGDTLAVSQRARRPGPLSLVQPTHSPQQQCSGFRRLGAQGLPPCPRLPAPGDLGFQGIPWNSYRPCISLKAMPAPHRSGKGYENRGSSIWDRCGFTQATAGGRPCEGRWWSVMMTSAPRLLAFITGPESVIPVSTVMMRDAPDSIRVSTAASERPCPSSDRLGR